MVELLVAYSVYLRGSRKADTTDDVKVAWRAASKVFEMAVEMVADLVFYSADDLAETKDDRTAAMKVVLSVRKRADSWDGWLAAK